MVELQEELADPERLSEPRRPNERRPARPARSVGGCGDRQERLVAPERPWSRRDLLVAHLRRDGLPVVHGLERAEATETDPARDRGILRLADPASQRVNRQRVIAPSDAEPTAAAYFANTPVA